MFTEFWGFSFSSEGGELIGDQIDPLLGEFWGKLEKFHGIRLNTIELNNTEHFRYIMKNALIKKQPIVTFIDSFWLPWEEGFQRYSIPHAFLTVGFDERSKCLYCTDNNIGQQNVALDWEYIEKGFINYAITFELLDKPLGYGLWKEIIKNAVLRVYYHDSFNKMRSFSKAIKKDLDIKQELQGYSDKWWRAPIYFKLREIIRGRKLFADGLFYLGNKNNITELCKLGDDLVSAAAQWEVVRGLLIKALHMKNADKVIERASLRIDEIAYIEEQIASQMKNIVYSNQSSFEDDLKKFGEMLPLENKTIKDVYNGQQTSFFPYVLASNSIV
ncbi:hypothetical protein QUG28_28025 [Bacillus hominis]|uniref:hypothetical protein n=1 Tax=Bacillus hominis TaxID=2817478 RepID=UPI0025A002DF|nr:hypothetical protein [Bacillus hominis]MDM5436487.1 hypothetical protein [Bacillus hominis]